MISQVVALISLISPGIKFGNASAPRTTSEMHHLNHLFVKRIPSRILACQPSLGPIHSVLIPRRHPLQLDSPVVKVVPEIHHVHSQHDLTSSRNSETSRPRSKERLSLAPTSSPTPQPRAPTRPSANAIYTEYGTEFTGKTGTRARSRQGQGKGVGYGCQT